MATARPAEIGDNSGIRIPSERQAAVLFLIQRLSKLTNERAAAAQRVTEIKRAAVNDGYTTETIAEQLRLMKFNDAQRAEYFARKNKALSSFGFSIQVTDAKPDLKLAGVIGKLQRESADRKAIGQEVVATYRAAKEQGIDVPALKMIIKLSRMDPEDRQEWFARVDNLGANAGFW